MASGAQRGAPIRRRWPVRSWLSPGRVWPAGPGAPACCLGLAVGCRSRGQMLLLRRGPLRPGLCAGAVRPGHAICSREDGLIWWEPPANRRPAFAGWGSRPGPAQLEAGLTALLPAAPAAAVWERWWGVSSGAIARSGSLCVAPVPIEWCAGTRPLPRNGCAARGCHS